jgi:hypothetical protein
MESEIKRIVEGNARLEDFDLIELETHKSQLDLPEELASIMRYSLLKHPHYSLMRDFEYEELSTFQIFRLIVDKYDDKAKTVIRKNNNFMDLNILQFCVVDDFPAASEDMCKWLHQNFDSAVWDYLVASWCIIGDYNLDGLKYSKDHVKMAERLGKHIDTNIYNISTYIFEYEVGGVICSASYCDEPDEDDRIFDKTIDFCRQENTIDNACRLGLKYCGEVRLFRNLINDKEYWDYLKKSFG